ncbi:protein phosphatase 2C domain-containing protein [Lachnospiraceae bacterium 46-61]
MSFFSQNYKIGNAQLLGNCEQQNDYFATEQSQNNLFVVVADGLTDLSTGRFASVIAVETLKYNYHHIEKYRSLLDYFKQSFGDIDYSIHKNITGNKAGTAVICSVIKDKKLVWANVGGCGLYLCRKGKIIPIHNEVKKRIEYGTLECKKRDVLLFCTEGIEKGSSELEFKEILSMKKHPYDKAVLLTERIKNRENAYQKNGTAVIVEI